VEKHPPTYVGGYKLTGGSCRKDRTERTDRAPRTKTKSPGRFLVQGFRVFED